MAKSNFYFIPGVILLGKKPGVRFGVVVVVMKAWMKLVTAGNAEF